MYRRLSWSACSSEEKKIPAPAGSTFSTSYNNLCTFVLELLWQEDFIKSMHTAFSILIE